MFESVDVTQSAAQVSANNLARGEYLDGVPQSRHRQVVPVPAKAEEPPRRLAKCHRMWVHHLPEQLTSGLHRATRCCLVVPLSYVPWAGVWGGTLPEPLCVVATTSFAPLIALAEYVCTISL